MAKFYPESKVEIQGLTAKYYDEIMNILSFGFYGKFKRCYIKIKNKGR